MKRTTTKASREPPPWNRNTAEYRWHGFGRYYAMFPPSFAYDAIQGLTQHAEPVLDPFCGRGIAPFTASVLGHPTVGIDINPVAWIFTEAKLNPEPDSDRLINRLEQVDKARKTTDRKGKSRFETMAWSPDVRAFLRAARRELDWKDSITDRTLMAFIALHMQDKLGAGLSNVLWPTIACSPQYAVKWWTEKGFHDPPNVDPVELLADKILRRYQYGIPKGTKESFASLADAREELPKITPINAGLLITSPPYNGVTDYWNDHWIRLWILGHEMRKNWKRAERYDNRQAYQELVQDVFIKARYHVVKGGAVLVRSDLRRRTAETCIDALRNTWPGRELLFRTSTSPHKGVSIHHGQGGKKAKEIDLLIPGDRGTVWREESGFRVLDPQEDNLSFLSK